DKLEYLIVDRKRAAGIVAETREVLAELDAGDAPRILVRDLERHADLGIDVLDAGQLLGDAVIQRVQPEARLIHLGRGEDPDVREHPLAGPRVGRAAIQRKAGVNG